MHRVVPRDGVDPGLVYLACSCGPVQLQLKALATGSVVDGLSEADVGSVIVPYDTSEKTRELGREACSAWKLFSQANHLEDAATSALEAEFFAAYTN